MKPCLLFAHLCDLRHYSWKAALANRFPNYILFIKKQTQWSNDKTIIELGYRKCLADQLFASAFVFDKSRYFAQPRPIIAEYWPSALNLKELCHEIQPN